jgi:hypothetical protein
MSVILSLYDYTGEAMRPWADAGYHCVCFDIQHSEVRPRVVMTPAGGSIAYVRADLHDREVLNRIAKEYAGDAVFMAAFPVCTDMAVSGAAHFAKKAEDNPLYQSMAVDHAVWAARVGDALGCPYFVENPRSVLSTHWRKPNETFEPWQYGGYLSESEAEHPRWPEYIAARDAYPKTTYLWTGGDFVMPEHNAVECPEGYSAQHSKLGGKSDRTKNIRSATPRGFAKAVFVANNPATRNTEIEDLLG